MRKVLLFICAIIAMLSCDIKQQEPCNCGATSYVSIRMYGGLELSDDYHGVLEIREVPSVSPSHKTWHLKICQKFNGCNIYEKNVDGEEIIKIIADW